MNVLTTYGRVASDVTLNEHNGKTVANFRFASTNRRKDNQGEYMTNFYSVSAWGVLAERAKQLQKGHRAVISGDFSIRTYIGTDGVSHQANEIDATAIDYGETKAEVEAKASARVQESRAASSTTPSAPPASESNVDDLDELPF